MVPINTEVNISALKVIARINVKYPIHIALYTNAKIRDVKMVAQAAGFIA